jgi:ABC-type multidrug transport system ATPase subunit
MSFKLLETDSIRFSYGQRNILTDISLRCQTGSVTGLLGRNGCGKSTLLQIIFGNIQSTDAIIRIDGQRAMPAWRSPWFCGLLPQQPYLSNFLSVGKACRLFGLDFQQAAAAIPQLEQQANKLVAELSYGSIRMLEIYLIIKKKGAFALLDEPFNGLSPIAREQVIGWIKETLPQKGFIISDHDYQSVLNCCDQLYLLRDGKNRLCRGIDDLREGGYLPS